jgi:hypothetical protein
MCMVLCLHGQRHLNSSAAFALLQAHTHAAGLARHCMHVRARRHTSAVGFYMHVSRPLHVRTDSVSGLHMRLHDMLLRSAHVVVAWSKCLDKHFKRAMSHCICISESLVGGEKERRWYAVDDLSMNCRRLHKMLCAACFLFGCCSCCAQQFLVYF